MEEEGKGEDVISKFPHNSLPVLRNRIKSDETLLRNDQSSKKRKRDSGGNKIGVSSSKSWAENSIGPPPNWLSTSNPSGARWFELVEWELFSLILFLDADNWLGFFDRLGNNVLPHKVFIVNVVSAKSQKKNFWTSHTMKKLIKERRIFNDVVDNTHPGAADNMLTTLTTAIDSFLHNKGWNASFLVFSGDKGFQPNVDYIASRRQISVINVRSFLFVYTNKIMVFV
jgi:hypothetical protein